MQMMGDLAHKSGRAVVIVTHDLRLLEFADRTIRIEDGLIAPARATSSAAILAQPDSRRAALGI